MDSLPLVVAVAATEEATELRDETMEEVIGILLTGMLLLEVLGKIITVLLTDGDEADAGVDEDGIAEVPKELLTADEGLVEIEAIEVVEALVLTVVVVVLLVVLVVVSLVVVARVVVVVLETPGQLLSIHLS